MALSALHAFFVSQSGVSGQDVATALSVMNFINKQKP